MAQISEADVADAFGSPTNTAQLMQRFREKVVDPSVVTPEEFGAPWVEDVANHNPETTKVADNAAMQLLEAEWALGKSIELRRRYGVTEKTVLQCTREGPKDGQTIFGHNRYRTGLHMTASGFDCLELEGLVASGGANNWHGNVMNMRITGATGTGKGIVNKAGTRINNGRFQDLLMYTGGPCLLHDDQFQAFYDQIHASSYNSDAIILEGGNATSIRGVYLSQVPQGFAGLRIWRMAGIHDTTGLDDGWIWAIYGGFPRWPTGSGTETLRTGSTTTRLRLATTNPFTPAFLSGFSVVSNTGEERRVKIGGNNATDGNYVDVTSAFSAVPTTVYFKDPWCPTATGRRPDISMDGHCNLEIPRHCAIKFAHEASFYARNGLFYTYEGFDYDTVFWCRDNRSPSFGIQLEGYTTYNEEGMEATRRLSRDLACEGSAANYRIGMGKGGLAVTGTETIPRYVNARTGALVNVTLI